MPTWLERALLTVLVTVFLQGIAAGESEVLSTSAPDPLAVKRTNPVFREAITDRKVDREVGLWYHGLYLSHMPEKVRALYTKEQWAVEQDNYLRESGEAGVDGPFMPWMLNNFGVETVERLHRTYGMKFPLMLHSSAHSAKAKMNGAVFTCENLVAPWDPKYIVAAAEFTEWWLAQYGGSPWLSEVMGRDEPLNYAASIRNPEAVAFVNAELKRVYGVKLALSPGDPSLPWYEWPTDPVVEKASPRDVALLRIAMWRWLNERLHEAAAREHEIVRRLAPGRLHFTYNRNAINVRDVVDKPVHHSIDFLDQARMYDVTDGYAADPYPTATLARDGSARALYHVGFVSKLVTDLASGKPTKMILQAFEYAGRTPTPDNLREWTSQAAKTGAARIEWYTYGNTRFSRPELHAELLRLSRLWKELPALDIPDTAEVAVIFGDDARAAANDAPLHGYYALHVLLGERLGAWFAFIGENHVRWGLCSLDRVKLLIAPQLGYVSREFAEKLAVRVEEGATLLVLDPDAFTWDFETGSLDSVRKRILGSSPGERRDADMLVPSDEARRRFGDIGKLPLGPGASGVNARATRVPKGATVLFTYGDGAPAAWSRPIGKGEVIAFAAMPFGNSEVAFVPGAWETFLGALLDRHGIARGLALWRFELPKTGGEVETFKPVVNMEYNTIK